MGILEVWSLINLVLKLIGKLDLTYWQVFKPMWGVKASIKHLK